MGVDGGVLTGGSVFRFHYICQFPIYFFLDRKDRHGQKLVEDSSRIVDANKGAKQELYEIRALRSASIYFFCKMRFNVCSGELVDTQICGSAGFNWS